MRTGSSLHRWLAASCAALLIAACGEAKTSAPVVEAMETPAGVNSEGPNLAVAQDGSVYLSWQEAVEREGHAVKYSRLANAAATWSAPVTVTLRDDLFVNWADFPSVLPAGPGRLITHWLQQSGDGPYTYDVRVAQSVDDGKTWSESVVLHDDGVAAEHGFVSLLMPPSGDVQAIWLDGRNTGEQSSKPEMQLGFTTIGAEGAPGPTQLIDTRICDCCQTSAVWTANGPVVVYRDRSDDEVRDISIVRQVDGKWTEPKTVHADNWRIEGCPVNGPSVAAAGNDVAVAWYTGAEDRERVNVAFSNDGGATFSQAVRVDDGNPAGRVSVVMSGAGQASVVWLERGEAESAEVRLRKVSPGGQRGDAIVVAKTSAARGSGFPRMAAMGEDILVAWTELAEQTQVRVALVRAAE